MSASINEQADLPFYLLGYIREFVNLFGRKTRIWRVNSEIKPGKKLELTGLETCQIALGFFCY